MSSSATKVAKPVVSRRSGRSMVPRLLPWAAMAITAFSAFALSSCEGLPNVPTPGDNSGLARGVAPSSLPSWVDRPYSRMPIARYLVGVGSESTRVGSLAEVRKAAEENARAQIAASIRAEVEQEVVSISTAVESLTNGVAKSKSTLDYKDITRVVGRGTLDGSNILERYRDPSGGVYYALAAMERVTAARAVASRVATLRAEGREQLDLSARLAQSGKFAERLGPLLLSYEKYFASRVATGTHRVLVGRDPKVEEPDQGAKVLAELNDYVGKLRLEVVKGDGQRGSAGAALADAIVLRVSLETDRGAVPARGIRLALQPESKKHVRLSTDSVVTDSRGQATFRVPLVKHTGKAGNAIVVSVDAIRRSPLDAPSVKVNYTLKTKDTLQVVVIGDETGVNGKPVRPPIISHGIKRAFRKAGYPLVDEAAFVKKLGAAKLLSAPAKELAAAIGDRIDVVVRVIVRSEKRQPFFAGQKAAAATLEVIAIDIHSGQTLYSDDFGPEPGSHVSSELAAAKDAMAHLAKDAAAEVTKSLAKVFGGS